MLLLQVAKVAAFQLSQYEMYSSRVKDFEVRGRQAHPRAQGGDYAKTLNTTGWPLLGQYTAAKMKGSQVTVCPDGCFPVALAYCCALRWVWEGPESRVLGTQGYICGVS